MPKQVARTLPPKVQRQLDAATDQLGVALWRLSEGASLMDVRPDFDGLLDGPIQAAEEAGRAARRPRIAREVDFGLIIREAIATLRRDARMTQAGLASKMSDLGFDWKRITVAEIERGDRRVTLEELLALAQLFAVPMVELLIPEANDYLMGADSERIRQIVLGG